MFLTYTPEGDAPRRFEFRPRKILASRAEMMERRFATLTGQKSATWDQFKIALQQGSASARRVLLWHVLSLEHPTLRVEDVDATEEQLLLEYSRSELQEMRDLVSSMPNIPEADLELMLTKLDMEIMTAPQDGDEGKALSKSSDGDTGSPSPNSATSAPASKKTS